MMSLDSGKISPAGKLICGNIFMLVILNEFSFLECLIMVLPFFVGWGEGGSFFFGF